MVWPRTSFDASGDMPQPGMPRPAMAFAAALHSRGQSHLKAFHGTIPWGASLCKEEVFKDANLWGRKCYIEHLMIHLN